MTYAPEHDIALRFDHGSTGRAFSDGTPFAIRRPFSETTTLPSASRFSLHFTQ